MKDEKLEQLFALLRENKFEEAKRYIEGLDVSAKRKADMNMSVWQMQKKASSSQSSDSPIPKIPVISMILGFFLICIACLFHGNTTTAVLFTGLFLVIVIPGIYCLRELRHEDKVTNRQEIESHRYAEEGADINFAKPIPSAWIFLLGAAGIGFFCLALGCFNWFEGNTEGLTMSITLSIGFAILAVCSRVSRRHNGTIMLVLLTISSFIFFICYSAKAVFPDMPNYFFLIFGVIGALPLIFFPFTFKIIKSRLCTKTVEAECVDIMEVYRSGSTYHGGFFFNKNRPYYYAFWKYSYNGITYVHKDMRSYKSPEFGEMTEIFIDPRDPHNIYRKKAPTSSYLFVATGLFLVLLAIFLMLE